MILFLLSYLAGALTIVSPCILPVLPFVFARAGRPFVRNGLPLLVGMAIAAGYGWTSTGWVGVGLSLGGFAIFVAAWAEGRRRAASKRLA